MEDSHLYPLTSWRLLVALFFVPAVVSSTSDVSYDYLECTYNRYTAACIGPNVIALYQENRGLTEFPVEDIKNRGYNCVKLNRNNILKFPTNTKYLASMRSLDVSDNEITKLPDDLDLMTELEILDLSRNLIKSLSPHTRYPASLRGLLLSGNDLKTIPGGIRIPGLFVLDLSDTSLDEITNGFCVSDQLIRVDFTGNQFKDDLSRYMPIIDNCRNINDIPFCVFVEKEDFTCDCNSLAPFLGKKQSFCMGNKFRGREMKCKRQQSGAKHLLENIKIFDINVTDISKTCDYPRKSQITNIQGQDSSANTLANVSVIIIGMVVFSAIILTGNYGTW